MKVLNVALVALLCVAALTVSGCRKHHDSNNTLLVEVDHNIYTPLHLTVVEIDDADGCIADGKITQEQLLADLDYVVLTDWVNDVLCNPCYAGRFTYDQLVAFAHQVKFRLIVSRTFELNRCQLHYAQIGDDIYIATEKKHQNRHCEWAKQALWLFLDDQKDNN